MSTIAPHTAKSVFFGCIDDRLVDADVAFIKQLKGGAFSPKIAGGGIAFLSEDDRRSAIKQVVAAYMINHVTDIYIESHTDCGAYNLAGITFASPTEEAGRLYTDLDQAAEAVHDALITAGAEEGEVTVHTRVVDPGGHLVTRPELHQAGVV
ncbi:MAG: hypothetical protein JWN01_758 [Patescibacteria group bacterium]|nr:hypothetical protein [Patescibacteria group bacterium]